MTGLITARLAACLFALEMGKEEADQASDFTAMIKRLRPCPSLPVLFQGKKSHTMKGVEG